MMPTITKGSRWIRQYETQTQGEGWVEEPTYLITHEDGRVVEWDCLYTEREDLVREAGEAAVLAFEELQAAERVKRQNAIAAWLAEKQAETRVPKDRRAA